jgi:putative zinc finger protein
MTRDRKEDSMSHVDEGTLHAYLDGELPPAERAGLESHLEQCNACQTLLTEEQALRERASALLGATRPSERPVPPFQELRRAQRRPAPWYARRTFAWAASLVLAVGLGYYLRGSPADVATTALSEQRALAAAEGESLPREELQRAFEKDEFVPAPPSDKARRSAPPASDVAQAPRLATVDSLSRHQALGHNAVQPPVALRGATPASVAATRSPDTILGLRDSLVLAEAVVTTAPPPATERRAAAAAAAPSVSRNDPRSVRNLVSTTWPLISRGKAASLLGDRPVGVPGLATRRIRQSPGADSTVVVEQALDSNTVIQIFQRPATASGGLESSERERAVLARYVGRLRVEITGPVSTDSLNKLLEQVEPIP